MILISQNGVSCWARQRFVYLNLLFAASGVLFSSEALAKSVDLRVGAARIDITPDANRELMREGVPFEGVHDPLHCRVIVLEDGATRAALVSCEIISIPETFWRTVSSRINQETGIPIERIILTATHTHSGPRFINRTGDSSADQLAYATLISDAISRGVQDAQGNLQPARMGVGTGLAYINVNRVAKVRPGMYGLGQNPAGPSDKTVHIVKFESLEGRPIAILINYAVHCAALNRENFKITADIAGATSRWVEKHYDDTAIALWTSGAAGDQNPIFTHQTDTKRVQELGYALGSEAIRVADSMTMSRRIDLRASQRILASPAKDSGDPLVDIRLSVLMLNHIALCGVGGEVFTLIGQRLKVESPFSQTMMLTHCNGSSGYLPDNEAYKTPGYGFRSSRVKMGVETLIVNELVDMMDQL